jgi:predicted AlkP superfamily pyrophosphatase or phosphodiesterase
MADRAVVFISIPGLRQKDLLNMPNLLAIASRGDSAPLIPTFPALTCPAQVTMTTGVAPAEHGAIANGYYDRQRHQLEMWTAWNSIIDRPQIWEVLQQKDPSIKTAVWFPMLSKGAKADYICTPAPIHNPDGSESLWCYTEPSELYGESRDGLGDFPLMNFWGPMADIKSSEWIVDSVIHTMRKYQPRFYYIYLPHLDYTAQKFGPNSPEALQAAHDLDDVIGKLYPEFEDTLPYDIDWLIAGEYAITDVDHVSYPNRVLREAGLLSVSKTGDHEDLDFAHSQAWALADHQIAHIYLSDKSLTEKVVELFKDKPGIDQVLVGEQLKDVGIDHPNSGDIVLVAKPNSWFAYYFWNDDAAAPSYAHTVDIHRKPGYDPVELFLDTQSKSIPLDATLVKGSHGALIKHDSQKSLFISTCIRKISKASYTQTEMFDIILKSFGL